MSPLDWGLGHASRMIPLIVKFKHDGHIVILAGSGRSGELLRHTFPGLKFISLPGNPIHMGSGKYSYIRLIAQLPAMAFSAWREHCLLLKIVRKENIDIVISDNRYGLYCKSAFSVLITHQVSPVLPAVFRWLEFPVYLIIRRLIQRFDQCWIPDSPDPEVNLSGKLSHRFRIPSNTRFIGILSRFSNPIIQGEIKTSLHYDFAIILSGPEPQVSQFEKKLWRQLSGMPASAILIRGMRNTPADTENLPALAKPGGPLHQVPHLETNSFKQILQLAGVVIGRSGYSSIMDFTALHISAILIPSPGQSEQEYLGRWLSEKGWFTCVRQDELDLENIPEVHRKKATEKEPFFEVPGFQFVEDLYLEYYNNNS